MEQKILKNLLDEMKKPGRECIYDMSNSSYKNNHKKQIIWTEIADAIGIERNECQALWKKLRRQHKSALTKSCGRSGSERVEVKGFSQFLLTEMDYFQNFWEDKEPTVTNYSDSNTNSFRRLFDEMARDPEVNETSVDEVEWTESQPTSSSTPYKKTNTPQSKREKLNEAEMDLKKSITTLNDLANKVMESTSESRDPFFLALEEEFSKVPQNIKSSLKVKLMSLVVENQQIL